MFYMLCAFFFTIYSFFLRITQFFHSFNYSFNNAVKIFIQRIYSFKKKREKFIQRIYSFKKNENYSFKENIHSSEKWIIAQGYRLAIVIGYFSWTCWFSIFFVLIFVTKKRFNIFLTNRICLLIIFLHCLNAPWIIVDL